MEEIFDRFPHIGNQILQNLNDQSLQECRLVSQDWLNFVENEKISWKRIKNIYPYIDGQNMLHIAAQSGQERRFETAYNFSIVMGKTNKQFVDNHFNTPLHYAAESGRLSICELIFNHVDDKNLENNMGETPLQMAAENGHSLICKLFIKDSISDDDSNPKNFLGNTPLHEAAKQGHLNVCQIIVDKVEDKNPANNGGTTPLHVAAMNGHVQICKLIIHNVVNKRGCLKVVDWNTAKLY